MIEIRVMWPLSPDEREFLLAVLGEPAPLSSFQGRWEGLPEAPNTGASGPSPAEHTAGPLPQMLPPSPLPVVVPAAVMGGKRVGKPPPAAWKTDAREQLMRAEWPVNLSVVAIRLALGALPGPAVAKGDAVLYRWAKDLGLSRPARVQPAVSNVARGVAAAEARIEAGPVEAEATAPILPDVPAAPATAAPVAVAAVPERRTSGPLPSVPRGPVPRLPPPGFDGKVRVGFEEIKAWSTFFGIVYDGGNMDVVNRRRQLNGQAQLIQDDTA